MIYCVPSIRVVKALRQRVGEQGCDLVSLKSSRCGGTRWGSCSLSVTVTCGICVNERLILRSIRSDNFFDKCLSDAIVSQTQSLINSQLFLFFYSSNNLSLIPFVHKNCVKFLLNRTDLKFHQLFSFHYAFIFSNHFQKYVKINSGIKFLMFFIYNSYHHSSIYHLKCFSNTMLCTTYKYKNNTNNRISL